MYIHRWVINEALSGIGLAATEPAASALLKEGLRRCDLLLRATDTLPAAGAGTGSSTSDVARVKAQPSSAKPSGGGGGHGDGDGWDFGEEDEESFDESVTTAAATAAAAATAGGPVASTPSSSGGGRRSAREETGGATAAGAPEPARKGSGRAAGGDDRDDGEEVARLRARLVSLRGLLETCLAVDGVQGLAFDVARLREFLALASGAAEEESGGEQRVRGDSSGRLLLRLLARGTHQLTIERVP